MSVVLVVARYNESVEWCRGYRHIIYNKGSFLENSIPLPNIGREAHTYLYHIVNNYDSLDDYTVFLQGNPFDHCRNILTRLDALKANRPEFQLLTHDIFMTTSERCSLHPDIPIREFHTRLFGEMPLRSFRFGAGAQFVVSKRLIQSIPKSAYESLLNTIHLHKGPWVIERFWEQIFLAGIAAEGVPKLLL